MPKGVKKTAVKKTADEEVKAGPLADDADDTTVEDTSVDEETIFEPVTYEGKTVVKVLDTGHTETDYHCEMSDRTTMHVPKSKFKLDE